MSELQYNKTRFAEGCAVSVVAVANPESPRLLPQVEARVPG